jgi:hypothetical protein
MRLAAPLLSVSLACVLGAQVPPGPQAAVPSSEKSLLQYRGKPVAVPFRCTADDIQWAGLDCSEGEPCPLYLELTAVESLGSKVFAIGNIHTETVTLYSILLASDDAGQSWHEAHDRIRGAGVDHIQFIDFETGWISGQALSPLPQDPFLLITGDGGKSWHKHNLFEENRFGSIQQFWFSAKNSGMLLLDRGQGAEGNRYELYESPNAGETWMIRETSDRPIKLKRGPSGDAAWRIRPDAATKSFRLERQSQTGRWSLATAFLVPLGNCVPPPVETAAEPASGEAGPSPVSAPLPTLHKKP